MLILCSNGLSSKQLLSSIVPFVDKGGTSALVVTADNQYKDKNYHVPRCMEELQSLGLTVDLFDIDISPVEQLLSYDVVEFIGGNPFYLLDSIHRHNATDTLQEIATKKILIGWSAAAFVFGPSLELANHDREHYIHYTCTDRKCRHSLFVPKPTAVSAPSMSKLFGKTDFKRMRYPVHVIEISDKNIKAFTHVAKKYHVDFALKKDTTTEQPRYLVFFKSRDADAITVAFQEFASRKMGRDEKPSIRERLAQAREQAAQKVEHRTLDREKVKVKERGVEL